MIPEKPNKTWVDAWHGWVDASEICIDTSTYVLIQDQISKASILVWFDAKHVCIDAYCVKFIFQKEELVCIDTKDFVLMQTTNRTESQFLISICIDAK